LDSTHRVLFCILFSQLFETSAKDDSHANHIESIFITLAHKLKASKPMMKDDSGWPGTEQIPPAVVLHRIDVSYIDRSPTDSNHGSSCSC